MSDIRNLRTADHDSPATRARRGRGRRPPAADRADESRRRDDAHRRRGPASSEAAGPGRSTTRGPVRSGQVVRGPHAVGLREEGQVEPRGPHLVHEHGGDGSTRSSSPWRTSSSSRTARRSSSRRRCSPATCSCAASSTTTSWYVIRNTPGVTGFVGQGAKPSPLRRKDVESFLAVVQPDDAAGGRPAPSPSSSTRSARPSGSREGPSPTSPARSSRSTRTSSSSRCWSTSSAGRPRWSSEFSQVAKL